MALKGFSLRGTWLVQSVELLTLGFGWGGDLGVMGSGSAPGSTLG